MKMIRRCFIVGLTIAVMMSTTSAWANMWGQTGFSGSQPIVLAGDVGKSTSAGTFTTTLANNSSLTGGTSYISYCVDLYHYTGGITQLDNLGGSSGLTGPLPLTNVYGTGSTDVPHQDAWDFAGFGRAAWLVDTFGAGLTSDAQRALLQIAVWKADYSSSGDSVAHYKDVTQGSEQLTDTGDFTQAQLNTIDYYLAASVAAGGGSTYATASALWVDFQNYNGNHTQDQLIGVPIPEPSTLAIGGLGMVGFLGYGLRRKRA
jgi:hypothetical protein